MVQSELSAGQYRPRHNAVKVMNMDMKKMLKVAAPIILMCAKWLVAKDYLGQAGYDELEKAIKKALGEENARKRVSARA